jgi:hypothetical protein
LSDQLSKPRRGASTLETIMDWNDPAARFRLAERVGTDEYNRQFAAHHAARVIETVNGHPIRPVQTRFGRLFAVGGTTMAFATIEQARAHAEAA